MYRGNKFVPSFNSYTTMNKTDLKNIKALLKYKEVVANGPKFESENSTITQEELEKYSIDELKTAINIFEKSETDKYTKELKNLVDEMFAKYGKEGDNMIAVWDVNVYGRDVYEGDNPLNDICWEGFGNRYNELYYPICAHEKEVPVEYYKDVKKLKDILHNLKVKNAYNYWKDDNEALNEIWYGVIGVMKIYQNYQVVSFVIRNDGMLCDEDGYETFNNKIIKKF